MRTAAKLQDIEKDYQEQVEMEREKRRKNNRPSHRGAVTETILPPWWPAGPVSPLPV